jgi:hypothetical protein
MRRNPLGCVTRACEFVQHGLNLYPPGPDDTEDGSDQLQVERYSPFDERDMPGGYVARFKLYRAAWKTCRDRIEVMRLVGPLVRCSALIFEPGHSAYC